MKVLKKIMQVGLAVFFLGLLATSTVLADTTGGQFVDKDNRKYYIKDDHKAIYWHKIDGKMYYFDDDGEMVVGWQYLEIPGTGYRDDLFDNRPVFEIGLQYKWYYFDQDGVLQEFVGWQQLEVKDSLTVGKKYGEGFEGPEVLKLANYYNTTYVKEYKKEYVKDELQNNVDNLQYDDYSNIAYEHNRRIMDSIKNAEKLSFIDTDFYSLQSFSILETGKKHPVVEDFVRHTNFDVLLYIRNISDKANSSSLQDFEYDKILQNLLKKNNQKYIELPHKSNKSLTENYMKSIQIINDYLEN